MNKYEVEFDNGAFVEIKTEPAIEEIFTEEYMEEWSNYFYDIWTTEGHLKQIAHMAVNYEYDSFWEGYGPVEKYSNPRKLTIIDGEGNELGVALVNVVYSGDIGDAEVWEL